MCAGVVIASGGDARRIPARLTGQRGGGSGHASRAAASRLARGPALGGCAVCDNRAMRLLRMKPGHGEVLIAEGDVEIAEQERELIAAFREQLDQGMWAAVPVVAPDGRRQAELVRELRGGSPGRGACDLLPARRGRRA